MKPRWCHLIFASSTCSKRLLISPLQIKQTKQQNTNTLKPNVELFIFAFCFRSHEAVFCSVMLSQWDPERFCLGLLAQQYGFGEGVAHCDARGRAARLEGCC